MKAAHLFGFSTQDSRRSYLLWSLLLLGILITCITLMVLDADQLPRKHLLFAVGVIGLWRYSWKMVHAARAIYYRHYHYPKLRAAADLGGKASELLVIVPSYRVAASINYRVYRKLFEELQSYGVPSRVAACITDPVDVSLIEKAREDVGYDVAVDYLPQSGKGKRSAMAEALSLFLAQGIDDNAQLVLMDGDTLLSDNVFNQSCCFLSRFSDLGAITCHNVPLVKGSNVIRQWYKQRMALRNFYMNSLSLSHGLLVLTGRFSLFRARILVNKDFIHTLEHDSIQHWRYGRLKMLTGDDKSSWFYLLRYRWKMLYLPDVTINCVEEAIDSRFVVSSLNLMKRWYGNMLRNNGRALALGPKHCGFFLWLCILDQRVSIWTTLTGPAFVGLFALLYSPIIFAAYLAWVIIGRGLNCMVIALVSRSFHPLYIFLLWYEQVIGSALKVYVLFRLNRQKWNRQKIQTGGTSSLHDVLWPRLLTLASVMSLVLFIALIHGFLTI
ncbi:glycosyltransferase [Gallaecimonas mangrovi]|uniref:glycosyltransferase n=1 Tax=Gallaecimonas mangrovi TaxID=2291597 RepID=UPI000E20A9EC|nr:glycosyltransferase [Gallaecimonas mangrovi]